MKQQITDLYHFRIIITSVFVTPPFFDWMGLTWSGMWYSLFADT
ncbi:hypothetical protein [Phocaeicola plebeius]|nr:hypothetical protein [Phocaeicola plebeius]